VTELKGSEYVSKCASSRFVSKQNTDSCEGMKHRFVHFETSLLAFIDIWIVKTLPSLYLDKENIPLIV
jgi:hypothetical protein